MENKSIRRSQIYIIIDSFNFSGHGTQKWVYNKRMLINPELMGWEAKASVSKKCDATVRLLFCAEQCLTFCVMDKKIASVSRTPENRRCIHESQTSAVRDLDMRPTNGKRWNHKHVLFCQCKTFILYLFTLTKRHFLFTVKLSVFM